MTDESDTEIAVPRDAIIFEGDAARVWVVRDDKAFVCEVSVHPDCEGGSHWRVEWGDSEIKVN